MTINITIIDLEAVSQAERQRLALYLNGGVSETYRCGDTHVHHGSDGSVTVEPPPVPQPPSEPVPVAPADPHVEHPIPQPPNDVHFTGHRDVERADAARAAGAIPLPPAAAAFTAGAATPPNAPTPAGPVPTPPGAVPSVNTVPQPPTAPSGATIDPSVPVDKAGVPWDERIHAGSKAFIADGTWRKRKNVSPQLYDQVSKELAAGHRVVTPTPENIPMPPGAERGPRHMGVATDMPSLNLKIVEAGLTIDDIRPALAAIGAPDMPFMSKVPALIPKLDAEIDKIIAARQGA